MRHGWLAAACLVCVAAVGCTTPAPRLNQRGLKLFDDGQYILAGGYFEQAAEYQPDNPDYLYNLAASHHRQREKNQAELYYRRCLELAPDHPRARRALAVLLIERGRAGQAVQLLDAHRKAQGWQAAPWLDWAWLYARAGRWTWARQMVDAAVAVDATDAEAFALLGDVCEATGRRGEAIDAYKRSLKLKPAQAPIEARLAALEQDAGATTTP